MAESRWQFARVACRVEVKGVSCPAVRFQADFELNAIPRAQVSLPAGRDPFGMASPIHSTLATLEERTPVKVFATLSGRAGTGDVGALGIPEGEFVLFDGDTTGYAIERDESGLRYVLHLQHWLGVLSDSSILSSSSYPGNPGMYTGGALLDSKDSGVRNWVGLTDAARVITPGAIQADLWGQAILPWLKVRAKSDTFLIAELQRRGSGANDGALAALARMGPKPGLAAPLALAVSDIDLGREIAADISSLTGDPEALAHQTFWDVLVGSCAPEFLFAVVPRVADALVVPYVAGQRSPLLTISADEYRPVSISAETPRLIRGFGILSGLSTTAGGNLKAPNPPPQLRVGGFFDSGLGRGMYMISQGPKWTTSLFSPSRAAPAASGGRGTTISTSDRPVAGGTPTGNDAARTRASAVIKPFLDRYAHARSVLESTRTRQGTLSGLFRLDIAPGSTVRIQGPGDGYVRDNTGLDFFAGVARVSLVLDAEGRNVGCGLHLTHVRSLRENEADATSIAEHPLYTEPFVGAPLTDP